MIILENTNSILLLFLILSPFIIAFIFSLLKNRTLSKLVNSIVSIGLFLVSLYCIYKYYFMSNDNLSRALSVIIIFSSFGYLALQRSFVRFLNEIKAYKDIKIINVLIAYLLLSPFLYVIFRSLSLLISGIILIIGIISFIALVILCFVDYAKKC